MRKLFLVFSVLLVIIGAVAINKLQLSPRRILGISNPTPAPSSTDKIVEFTFGNQNLAFWWYEVGDTSKIKIIPNFSSNLSIKDVAGQNNCEFVANAGFYTSDNRPTGLFITDGKTLRGFLGNKLLNGIYSVNYLGTPRITREVPQDPLYLAVQTGPFLIENAQKQSLDLANDKPARRMIVATTGENKTVFIVVYDPASNFNGPYLADLPQTLKIFEDKTNIFLADAVNLDGGAASGIFDGEFYLSNASPIGGYFCVIK